MAEKRHFIGLDFEGDDSGLQATVVRTERVIDQYADAVAKAANKTKTSAAENGRYERSLSGLVAKYNPAQAAASRYHKQQETLNRALKDGKITGAEYSRYLSGVQSDYLKASKGADSLDTSHGKLHTSSTRLTGGFTLLQRGIAAVGGAYAAWQALSAADDFGLLESRVRLATESTGDYAETMAAVYEISQQNGVALQDTVDLYTSIQRSAEDLGASNGEILKFTEAVQQMGIVSGASDEAMSNALRQMSQSFAGGVVRAEEFNSVLENTPEIAQAMARGLGKSLGEVRKDMLDGMLSSEDMFNAIISQSDEAERKFGELPVTMDRAMNSMRNSAGQLADTLLNDLTGATGGVAGSIQSLSGWMDSLSTWMDQSDDAAEILGGTIALTLTPALYKMGMAMSAALGPIGLVTGALGGLAVYAISAKAEIENLEKSHITGAAGTDKFVKQLSSLKIGLRETEEEMSKVREASGEQSAEYIKLQEKAEGYRKAQDAVRAAYVESRQASDQKTTADKKQETALTALTKEQQKQVDVLKNQYLPEKVREAKFLKEQAVLQAAAARGDEAAVKALQKLVAEYQKGGKAGKAHAAGSKQAAKELAALEKKVKPVESAFKAYKEELEKLDVLAERNQWTSRELGNAQALLGDEYADTVYKITDYNEALKEQEKQEKATQAAQDDRRDSMQKMLDELYPLETATREYHDEAAALEATMTEFGKTPAQIADALQRLGTDFADSAADAAGLGEANKDAANESTYVWTAYRDGIEGMTDALFEGEIRSASDFADKFVSIMAGAAKDAASEFAANGIMGLLTGQGFSGFNLGGSAGVGGGGSAGSMLSDMAGNQAVSWLTGGATGYAANYGASLLGGAGSQQAAMLAAQTGEFGAFGASSTSGALGVSSSSVAAIAAPLIIAGLLENEAKVFTNMQHSIFGSSKWRTSDKTINAGYSGGDFSGSTTTNEWQKGGTFHRNDHRTRVEEISSEIESAIDGKLDAYRDLSSAIGNAWNPDGVTGKVGDIFGGINGVINASVDGLLDMLDVSASIDLTGLNQEEIDAAINEWIESVGMDMVKAVTPQLSGIIDAAGANASALWDPLMDIASFMAADFSPVVQASLADTVNAMNSALSQHVADYDGSVTSTQLMAEHAKNAELATAEFLTSVRSIRDATAASTQSLQDMIYNDTHSDTDIYNKLNTEMNTLADELALAVDPSEIANIRSELDGKIRTAWNMVPNVMEEASGEWENDISAVNSSLSVMRARETEMRANLQTMSGDAAVQQAAEIAAMQSNIAITESELTRLQGMRDQKMGEVSQGYIDFIDDVETLTTTALDDAESWALAEHTRVADVIENKMTTVSSNLNASAQALTDAAVALANNSVTAANATISAANSLSASQQSVAGMGLSYNDNGQTIVGSGR